MKKIYINGRFLTQNITGVQRYAHELVKAIDRLIDRGLINKDYSFYLLHPKNCKHNIPLKHVKTKQVGFFQGHFWEQFELPFFCGKHFLINLCNTGPMCKRNQMVVIHDAAVFSVPRFYSFLFRIWYKLVLIMLGINAKRIITVSQFSKGELSKWCKISLSKLNVIYLGVEHLSNIIADTRILQEYRINEKPYVLAVSSLNPNKNFKSIVQAIQLLGEIDFNFVIAGGVNPAIFNQSNNSLPKFVKYLGYISDEELKALYQSAACFVYPSFYEGFGLPPLEAMSCGTPVIVSKVASLPEVCGEAALYINPAKPEDIAAKTKLIMSDENLRNQMVQKGFEQVKRFTWEECAKEFIFILEEEVG